MGNVEKKSHHIALFPPFLSTLAHNTETIFPHFQCKNVSIYSHRTGVQKKFWGCCSQGGSEKFPGTGPLKMAGDTP
eukprot:1016313-Pelagomonas_calceolata.AAC.2